MEEHGHGAGHDISEMEGGNVALGNEAMRQTRCNRHRKAGPKMERRIAEESRRGGDKEKRLHKGRGGGRAA